MEYATTPLHSLSKSYDIFIQIIWIMCKELFCEFISYVSDFEFILCIFSEVICLPSHLLKPKETNFWKYLECQSTWYLISIGSGRNLLEHLAHEMRSRDWSLVLSLEDCITFIRELAGKYCKNVLSTSSIQPQFTFKWYCYSL